MGKFIRIERFPEGEKAASIVPCYLSLTLGKRTWSWKKRDA